MNEESMLCELVFWARFAPFFDAESSRQALAHWFQIAQLQLRGTQELQHLVLGATDQDWSEQAAALSAQLEAVTHDLSKEIV